MSAQDLYEAVFVLDGELSEDALTKAQTQITEQIAKVGGTIERQEPWGKRRLAYRLRKRRDGFYLLVVCRLPAPAVGTLEAWCALQDTILRRLVVKAQVVVAEVQPAGATTSHGQSQ